MRRPMWAPMVPGMGKRLSVTGPMATACFQMGMAGGGRVGDLLQANASFPVLRHTSAHSNRAFSPLPMSRTALTAGSTGLIGQLLLQKLLDSRDYTRVIAVTRRPLG